MKNKNALIIGGTSGIGWATTQQLLNQGVHVHIVGRNPDKIRTNTDDRCKRG